MLAVRREGTAMTSTSRRRLAMTNVDELTTEVVRRAASQAPDRIAVQEAGGLSITNGALHAAALKWADALHEAGVDHHDRVAVMLPNSVRAFAVQLAAGWLGATVVWLDTVLL